MTHPRIKTFGDNLRAKIVAGEPLPGQSVEKPSFWIEVTKGGAGYFAVMVWDGDGFPEPWETGVGRYETEAEATAEAKSWAESEGLEFREGSEASL